MEKAKTVNVIYKNEKKIMHGLSREIINQIACYFKINMNEHAMYALNEKGEKVRIMPDNLTDIMSIEILPKKRNGQKIVPALMEAEVTNKKLMNDIVEKLTKNTPLTGRERKSLIEAFEHHSTAIFKKRKLDQSSIINLPTLSHKKVQVNISSFNTKESFTQTDPLPVAVADDNDDNDNNEDFVSTLKRLWNIEKKSNGRISTLMKKTYDDRRTYICVKNPPIVAIKEQYPALFCFDQVKRELDRIFYPGKCEEFLANMEKYSNCILHYIDDSDNKVIAERIKKALKRAETDIQKTYAEIVGSVFLLTNLLQEKFDFLHLSDYKPPVSSNIYPHIDASSHLWKEVFFDQLLFNIIVEQQHLCEASNFPEAILCLVASHFIFNIDYPESCRRTLIVFEKLYLKANDTTDIDSLTLQFIKLFELKLDQQRQNHN